MTTLHLVNQSPARTDALDACLSVMRAGDALLLLEDGVLAALGAHLDTCPAEIRIQVLGADADARGITARLSGRCERVDYAGFVAACTAHDRVVSWT